VGICLITGASSGIGLELAKVHASKGGDLVLVSRDLQKLNSLKTELTEKYKVKVYVLEKDLSVPNSAQEVFNFTQQNNLQVDYLINNAGFGLYGFFSETEWEKESQMINLNILTLTHLTKLYLPEMIKRKSGKIMNVASTAAFQPGPLMSVYFATKAYVLSFSQAISNEVKEYGITVTAVCPGATESNFQKVSGMDKSGLVKGKKLPSSKEVAEFGYSAMLRGDLVATHGFRNKISTILVRFIPNNLLLQITRKIQS
jgi:short-subunit dehydrogenase